MTNWNKKLAGIRTEDLNDNTKDATWVSWVLMLLCALPLMGCAGLAGGLICYISICIGAGLGDIQATLYVCIFVLVALGLLFCGAGAYTKYRYRTNKQAYRTEVEKRRNQNLGGQMAYGQPQPQTQVRPVRRR